MSVQAPVSGSRDGLDDATALTPTLDPTVEAGSGPDGVSRLRRAVDGPIAGVVALLAVLAAPAVEVARILAGTAAVGLPRRIALSQVGARRASHLDQLTGPLTRFGFHQPGPALYYLLAAFVRIGPPTRGVFIGALVVNGGVLSASVAVVWRRFGGPTALWAAVAIDVWCLRLGVGALRDPAAAAMLVAPIVLLVVLWAASVSGTRGAYVWAVVVASCEVQTHLVTGIFSASLLLIGAAASMVAAAGDGRLQLPDRWWRSPSRSLGVAALVLVWVPPVVESTGGRPDNMRAVFDFVTGRYPTLGLHRALTAASDAATTLPLGRSAGAGAVVTRGTGALVAVGAGTVLVGTLTLWLAYQRRSRAAYSFTAAAVVGGVIGALSLTRTVAGDGPPTAAWLAYVPLCLLLGLGAALLGPLGPERAGPGFVASSKAPFKWVKKHLSKRSKIRAAGVRQAGDERRHRAQPDKKVAGKAKSVGRGATGHRPVIPSPQWTRPGVWVVAVLLAAAVATAGVAVRADVRTTSLQRAYPHAVTGRPSRPR